LEKNPDLRFQNITAVQRELASIRLSPQAAAAPPAATARKKPPPANRGQTTSQARKIDEHLNAAQRAYDSGDYDAAIESCKQVLLLDASAERAIACIDRIHAAIDDQQLTVIKQSALDPNNADARARAVAAEAVLRER